MKDGILGVISPMFDDWSRTEDFDLRGADASLEFAGEHLLIAFPDEATRDTFRKWLAQANTKARQGYRTMWP
jgi:hypothetical protein